MIFRNWALQNFPFLEDDFDALTDYELFCKMIEYMKKSLDKINEYNVTLNEFRNELDTYKTYFDNLDVQEEINNKLDEMAEDGTLENIISEYIQLQTTYTYNSVSEMKLATNLVNGSFARTSGFRSYHDGGGSLYKIRTVTNSDALDEQFLIALYDENLVAELIIDNEITPEQIGAYGDGTHDDSSYISACLTKYNTLNLYKTYKISTTLGSLTNKNLIGNHNAKILNYVSTTLFNELTNCRIENLIFENKVTDVDSDGFITGNFAYNIIKTRILNCTIKDFSSFVSNYIKTISIVENCNIEQLNNIFTKAVTDSFVSNNYINAKETAVTRSCLIRNTIDNSSFNNNFIDYWRICFLQRTGSQPSQIIGNTFDNCFNVFYDHVEKLTIVGNTFTNIKYVSANWTTQPPEAVQQGHWSIFRFDNQSTLSEGGSNSCELNNVVFANNLTKNCSYYIKCETDVMPYLWGVCNFNNNDTFACTDGIDVGFTVSSDMIEGGATGDSFFDFWEYKTFETLPRPSLTGTAPWTRVETFNNMHCIVSGEEYININGAWKKYTVTSVV